MKESITIDNHSIWTDMGGCVTIIFGGKNEPGK